MPVGRHYTKAATYLRDHGLAATVGEAAMRGARRLRMGGLPPSVHVEISNVCNLDCAYCVLDDNAQGDRIMRESTFERVLPFLRDARRVDVSGLAEPLMNPKWPSFVSAIRRATPCGYIAMCSNATLLSRDKAQTLVEHGLDQLVFSLDGVDAEMVDGIRRGGSFFSMTDNLLALQEIKATLSSSRPELSATMVLQRSNVGQLADTIRLAAKIGAASVNVNGLEPYTGDLLSEVVWSDAERFDYLPPILREAQRAAQETGLTVRITSMRPARPACPQVHRPMILADGAVVPCSVLAYDRRSLLWVDESMRVVEHDGSTARVSFGNINDESFRRIWASPEYRSFRSAVSAGRFPSACSRCLVKHDVICPTPPLTIAQCLGTLQGSRLEGAA